MHLMSGHDARMAAPREQENEVALDNKEVAGGSAGNEVAGTVSGGSSCAANLGPFIFTSPFTRTSISSVGEELLPARLRPLHGEWTPDAAAAAESQT